MSTGVASPSVEGQAPAGDQPAGVPWRTVLPLGVVLAFADGFWVTSLRGAVGAIERTQTPFASWVRESTLSVPFFVLAALGALTLARRWYGPSADRPRRVLLTALLVAVAGTLAGVVELAASSAYDLRLQLEQAQMMGTMRQTCTGTCLAGQDAAAFWLQVRSVGWGTGILLATNLVLMGVAVAFLGGRLTVSSPRADGPRTASRAEELRALLVAGLLGSAVIHAAVVPEHQAEWAWAAMFFVALTLAELGAAHWLLGRARPPGALLAAAAVSAAPLLLWMASRSVGLPFGPEPGVPESVGLADVSACLLEVATLALAVGLVRASGWTRGPAPRASHGPRLALVALVAVTTLGLAGTQLPWFQVVVHAEHSQSGEHTAHAE